MKGVNGIGLSDVQAVYSGPEGDLWKLVMGEQIHIGGLVSSMALASRADIRAGSTGVDLCCCLGAGMRFLVRFRNVGKMIGVDATEHVVSNGRRACSEEGLGDRIEFVRSDVLSSGLPTASADFIWGEDAWCYVTDKTRLISEASRIVKPGGTIAFTDWVEGPAGLSDPEAQRFLRFMKFPNVQSIDGYAQLLKQNGCTIVAAEDTGRFAEHVELYIGMLSKQLTYDALKIIGFNQPLMQSLAGEMQFMLELAKARKLTQGLFVARKER